MYSNENMNYLGRVDYQLYNDDNYLIDQRGKKEESCQNMTFVDPLTGLIRGNLSRDEFLTYKKYIPMMPKLRSERGEKLFEVQKYDFAIHELKLYLDLCPNNKEALELLKKYVSERERNAKQYIDKYGPICPKDNIYFSKWIWINAPWPWEGDK